LVYCRLSEVVGSIPTPPTNRSGPVRIGDCLRLPALTDETIK
jgi:hypothetical protein